MTPPLTNVGSASSASQRRHDHPGRGGLAVGAGDRDEPAAADQPVERLRAVDDRHPALLRGGVLRVLGPDRAGVDHGVGVAEVRGVVPDVHAGAEVGELAQRLAVGAVGARDPDAPLEEHPGEPGHAGAADADEVRGLDVLGDGKAQVGSDHDPSSLSWAGGCPGPGALAGGPSTGQSPSCSSLALAEVDHRDGVGAHRHEACRRRSGPHVMSVVTSIAPSGSSRVDRGDGVALGRPGRDHPEGAVLAGLGHAVDRLLRDALALIERVLAARRRRLAGAARRGPRDERDEQCCAGDAGATSCLLARDDRSHR